MRIHMAVEACRLSNDVRSAAAENFEADNEEHEFQFQIADDEVN